MYYIDMYVRQTLLGTAPLGVMWASDKNDQNLVQVPNCDRPEDGTLELAVELTRLEARRAGRAVVIQWATASEIKNAGFRVWRQGANGDVAPVGRGLIPARGNELAGAAYRVTDYAAPRAATTYWLEDVSTTGAVTRHGPITVGPAAGGPIDLPRPGEPLPSSPPMEVQ